MKTVFIILCISLYLGSWQLVDGVPSENATAFNDSTDMNPNGSSELSLLMREMLEHAQLARKLALEEKINPEIPESFNKIHTAKATDSETKNSYYDTFADVYLSAVKSYSTSKGTEIVSSYNNLVNTCLACHSTHCPGPVPRIKKLLVP
ncbi:MAG: hypothetical protein EYC69_13660 [Bacteroidetes bacterium]|nr:MAG: hypothetical protein EYC69_13660 [Bacteroidota bacterium]